MYTTTAKTRIQRDRREERQSAENERRNDACEFGVQDVRAKRADHEGAEHLHGGPPMFAGGCSTSGPPECGPET